ncbi:ATP-binding cassette domain-containing protein [Gammaproteobacteria bacterium]|jgi:ABC-type Fe3+/spermidine/putrescine transport system ATPase subunit|nr:ATP-binding cassette domain-containing protein [Gammaproteobacteria bacterium]|tara:strand:- start:848 stop:1474 length:627 start_codon:yes stop_codon:yes gene_type:complete
MSLLISNLSFSRKNEIFLLNKLNINIKKGDLLIIQGESGCGKTTLLNIISGLIDPSSGEIQLNEVIINSDNYSVPSEKRNIGYIFQDYALFPHLTAKDNAIYALDNLKGSKLQQEYIVNALNLKEHLNKYPFELSGGQQQRVAIARALLMHPSLLIMDEPFSGLDKENSQDAQKLIQECIKELNIPAILVTHSLEHLDILDTSQILKI